MYNKLTRVYRTNFKTFSYNTKTYELVCAKLTIQNRVWKSDRIWKYFRKYLVFIVDIIVLPNILTLSEINVNSLALSAYSKTIFFLNSTNRIISVKFFGGVITLQKEKTITNDNNYRLWQSVFKNNSIVWFLWRTVGCWFARIGRARRWDRWSFRVEGSKNGLSTRHSDGRFGLLMRPSAQENMLLEPPVSCRVFSVCIRNTCVITCFVLHDVGAPTIIAIG